MKLKSSTMLKTIFAFIFFISIYSSFSQAPLLTNIQSRKTIDLNGRWHYIVDPYETGFYDYRFKERYPNDREAYWNSSVPSNKTDRKEFGFSDKQTLQVPGDWNSQQPQFLYYEGTVWYQRNFHYNKPKEKQQVYLYFGAINYKADVYLNGKKLGAHKGGFTPFNFFIADSILQDENNLVVKVDNKRYADEVPTLNTDWWNYGGITRDVKLLLLPVSNAIVDYFIQLYPAIENNISGWIKLDHSTSGNVVVKIPELKVNKTFPITGDSIPVQFVLPEFKHWSPEHPMCYKVIVCTETETLTDKIGFRKIQTDRQHIILNDKPVFLRGISIHEEIPQQRRRAYTYRDALQLLGWAKELGCNMVRLAHYPHDETMTRVADSLGILVWSEIPVYWTIAFSNDTVLQKAQQQLREMITRDHNRASVIIWSVGNETPVSEARTNFMHTLVSNAKALDNSRLVTAALEVDYASGNFGSIDDPLGAFTDIISFNEYLGWYRGKPESIRYANWTSKYNKPLFISETGAEALSGFHGDSTTMWSEELQAYYYKEQVAMLKRMPVNFAGISPWILVDFRSPRRNNSVYQNGWNNKGLISQQGKKKKAFYVLQKYYAEMKKFYGE